MRAVRILLAALITILLTDSLTSRKLINKYLVIGMFGKSGSGKSVSMTKMMFQHSKHWMVFSDVPNALTDSGVINYFDSSAFKRGDWLPDGRKGHVWVDGTINEHDRDICLFFDEMGILYNNRAFKDNLSPKTLEWWKTHRHKRVRIIYASQSYKDMDLKIRQLTHRLYLVKRGFLKNFCILKSIAIHMDIENPSDSSNDSTGGTIVEKFSYELPIFWKFTFLPKWIKKYDSYR